MPRDMVDDIVEQWGTARPDLDASPISIVGRISRLSRIIDRHLQANFATFGIEDWMYDVLATLRRNGAPYQLTAGQLVAQTMVTTGAMTNRVDRLAERGLVERLAGTDRRTVIVGLTKDGVRLVDRVVESHLDVERQLLSSLSPTQQRTLAASLRNVLVDLGDLRTP